MGALILNTPAGQIRLHIADPEPAPAALSATHNLSAGKATIGQVIPRGAVPAGQAIRVGSLETQCDIKSTYSDGSPRFVILTCFPTETGDYSLSVASPSSGTFTSTIPAASVAFTISGTTWTATLPSTVSGDPWLSGPLVREWRHVVAPLDPSSNPHPWLRVLYDTRVYNDGAARLDICVENCLDVTGATVVTYDVAITVAGDTVFSQSAVSHWYLARWRKVFGVGLTESTARLDFEPAFQAGALPRYRSSITSQSYSTVGSTFALLGRGGNTFDRMNAVGGRPEIAPYPDWAARFLVHQTASQRAFVLTNGDLAGSWPIHIRESNGSFVSIDARPNFWLDTRGQVGAIPVNDRPKGNLSSASRGPLEPDVSHTPSLAYVPYLTTGDRYYADEMAFWTHYALLSTVYFSSYNDNHRHRELGIVGTEQPRGRAWSTRNLADAAAYLPDADPARSYFREKLANNLEYFDENIYPTVNALGWVLPTVVGDQMQFSQWQNNYIAWAIGHANAQGFEGGSLLKHAIEDFQLKLFMSGPAYPREYGAPYWPVGARLVDGVWVYYTTMGDFFEGNYRNPDSSLAPPNTMTSYGIDARLSLLSLITRGVSGAQETYDWLLPQVASTIADKAGWAIV